MPPLTASSSLLVSSREVSLVLLMIFSIQSGGANLVEQRVPNPNRVLGPTVTQNFYPILVMVVSRLTRDGASGYRIQLAIGELTMIFFLRRGSISVPA